MASKENLFGRIDKLGEKQAKYLLKALVVHLKNSQGMISELEFSLELSYASVFGNKEDKNEVRD